MNKTLDFITGKTSFCSHYPKMCKDCGDRRERLIQNWATILVSTVAVTALIMPFFYVAFHVIRIWGNDPLPLQGNSFGPIK